MTKNEVTLVVSHIKSLKNDVDKLDARTTSRLNDIEAEVRSISAFRWQVFGGGLVVSALVGVLTSLVVAYVSK